MAPWRARPALHPVVSVGVTVVAGLVFAALISPGAGLGIAAAVGVSCVFRRGRLVLAAGAVGALAAAAAAEVYGQVHHRFPLVLEWPQHFEDAGRLAWIGLALLAADTAIDWLRPPPAPPAVAERVDGFGRVQVPPAVPEVDP